MPSGENRVRAAGRASAPLEAGWVLSGRDGAGRPIRLVFGDTELSEIYLGLVVGRHPALCDRVIDDPSVSRRHMRIGMAEGKPYVEDLNSLNGTLSGRRGGATVPAGAACRRPGADAWPRGARGERARRRREAGR